MKNLAISNEDGSLTDQQAAAPNYSKNYQRFQILSISDERVDREKNFFMKT